MSRRRNLSRWLIDVTRIGALAAGLAAGCVDGGGGADAMVDGGSLDAPSAAGDARNDGATKPDASPADVSTPADAPMDVSPRDAGPGDAPDAEQPRDVGSLDAGPPDVGSLDAGPRDAGSPDAGPPDAGAPQTPPALSLQLGGANSDSVSSLSLDPSDGFFIADEVRGSVNFGGALLTSNSISGVATSDPYVAHFSATGAHLSSALYATTADGAATSVFATAGGGFVLTGTAAGTATFGSIVLGGALTNNDAFVAAFDATGTPSFASRFGAGGRDASFGAAVDALGNVYVTGAFQQSVGFGSETLMASVTDGFLVKLNPAGVVQFARRFTGSAVDLGQAVAVDGAGNVHVYGSFRSETLDVGGPAALVSNGGQDVFVVSYDAMGRFLRARSFGGPGDDWTGGLAVDAAGNILLGGTYAGQLAVGATTLTSAGAGDVFVICLDGAYSPRFARSYGSEGEDFAIDVATNPAGDVALVGQFAINGSNQAIDLGGAPLVSRGAGDAFIARFDASGRHILSRSVGGTGRDLAAAVRIDSRGRMVVAGTFEGTVDLGNGPTASRGGTDIFVMVWDRPARLP